VNNRPPSANEVHLTDIELARLVDASAPADVSVAEHLAVCRRCMAIYAEFVHIRAAHHSPGGLPVPPTEWIQRGLAAGTVKRLGPLSLIHGRFARRFALAAAAAVFCLVGGAWSVDRVRLQHDHERLAARLQEDSFGGLLYSEAFEPVPSGVRGTPSGSGTDEALADLARRSRNGPRTTEDAFWLVAGFLAHNDLDNADAYLRAARRLPADDSRLTTLAGILAYKRNDLPTAAAILKAAVEQERSATNLYNLSMVLEALGDQPGAAALTGEIKQRFPGSWVAGLVEAGLHPGMR
jgi:tetratricopeptide (TPR) repeat protein